MDITRGQFKFPDSPLTLSPDQIEALAYRISKFRHDIANDLTILHTVAEMAGRVHPEVLSRMDVILRNSEKIHRAVQEFTAELEAILGIKRVTH